MTSTQDLPDRPLPFGGDRRLWVEEAQRALDAQETALFGRGAIGRGIAGGPLPVERTGWGWIRWGWPPDDEMRYEDSLPMEIGVFAPAPARRRNSWLARTVWGRRPLPRWESPGGATPAFSVSVARCAVLVITVLFASHAVSQLVPGWGLLASAVLGGVLAWGLPAVLMFVTVRQVRVVGAQDAVALLRMLAAQQVIAQAAAVSPEDELRRATALGHRFLWDSIGLVLASEFGSEELDVLDSYADAYERLVGAAVAVVNDRAALEAAIIGPCFDNDDPDGSLDRAYLGLRRTRMVEQAAPAELLHAAARDLEELTAGLRHARSVVAQSTADEAPTTTGGDGHVEQS